MSTAAITHKAALLQTRAFLYSAVAERTGFFGCYTAHIVAVGSDDTFPFTRWVPPPPRVHCV